MDEIPEGAVRASGAVFGPVAAGVAVLLVRQLMVSDDPDRHAQDLPWMACAVRRDGSLAVTCSTMMMSGVFWSREPLDDGWRFCVGTDPLAVARARLAPGEVSGSFLAAYLVGTAEPTDTPFRGVFRSWAGDTLVLDPRTGGISRTPWCAPETLPPPTRTGERVLLEYRDTFDEVVRDLAALTTPLVATLSGGLDSTYLVASLVRACPAGERVHAYCHSPLPEAGAVPVGCWEPDDLPYARLMAERYPQTIELGVLRNEARVHPLDAAERVFRASGWPVRSPANTVWLNDFDDAVAGHGASLRFVGSHGNATFSADHRYPGDGRRSWGPGPLTSGTAWARPWRSGGPLIRQVVRRAISAWRTGPGREPSIAGAIGLRQVGARGAWTRSTREDYLRWVTGRNTSASASLNPARTPGVLGADPFAARRVIELAAEISPREWNAGGTGRALARRLAVHRVPDAIRTRTTRGGQGQDAWYVIRSDPDRLTEEVAGAVEDPLLVDLLDRRVALAWLDRARQTPATAAPPVGWNLMFRLVALTRYARWARRAVRAPFPETP
jgi:hypothetical protein